MLGLTTDTCSCDSLEVFVSTAPSCLAVTCLVSVQSEEYTNLDSVSVDFGMVSVFCLLGATVDTYHASVFGFFWMIFPHFSPQIQRARVLFARVVRSW